MPRRDRKTDQYGKRFPNQLFEPIGLGSKREAYFSIPTIIGYQSAHDARTALAKRRAAVKVVENLREAKLKALFHHYNIEPSAKDAWKQLTLQLLENQFPGFVVKQPPKNVHTKTWQPDLLFLLWNDIQNYRHMNPGTPILMGCAVLVKTPFWHSILTRDPRTTRGTGGRREASAKTLAKRYADSTKSAFVLLYSRLIAAAEKDAVAQKTKLREACQLHAQLLAHRTGIRHPLLEARQHPN